MTIALYCFLLLVGIVLIVKGGDFFVDAATWIAEVSGVPKLIVGATVVSIATTLPEMFVSSIAAVDGKIDMSIGNAVGSVTANVGLILALSLLFMPAVIERRDYLLKTVFLLASGAVLVVFGLFGGVGVPASILLIVIFGCFMAENVHAAWRHSDSGKDTRRRVESKREVVINILKFVFGTAGIIIGAQLLVHYGSELARLAHVSERVISITVLAIGTSLPELVTTITAIVKRQSSLSVGNIIGANIIDVTLILPVCAALSRGTLPISASYARVDVPIMLLVCAVAMVPALIRKRFSRVQGVILLLIYAVYMTLSCFGVIGA